MDIKSLYTVIANNEGLQAIKHHLDVSLVLLAELVLNLNTFEFNSNFYQ